MIIDQCDDGKLTLTGNLTLRRVEHGMGSLPILELDETEYLGDLLHKYLEPKEPNYGFARFGKVCVTIEKA